MTHGKAGSIRLGCVQYLNARPLIKGWPGPVLFDHPSALCRLLDAGELDVALVSSFECLRAPVYSIIDRIAVAADGPVYSVVLVYRGDIQQIECITVDPASCTSVNLLLCLLRESGLNPKLESPKPGENDHIAMGQAKLMIGDAAIRFRERYSGEFNYWDLGEGWKRATGLPFVFALWLIRPEVTAAKEIAKRLRALRDSNMSSLNQLIAGQTDFSPEFCRFYFHQCLRFGFAEPEKNGLLRFRALCEKYKILPVNTAPLRLV